MSVLGRRLTPAAAVAAVGLGVSLAWLGLLRASVGDLVFPLDDTYIHLQYARELAAGRPFSYDAGDGATTGATSTLWPILLAPGFWLGSLDAGTAWAAGVCALLVAATGAALVWAATPLASGRLAALAALTVVLNGWFLTTALSGMESALIALGVAVLLGALARRLTGATVAALTVVALTRPEGALAAAFLAVVLAVRELRAGRGRRSLAYAVPLLAVVAQAAAWTAISGRPTTDTAISKSVLYDPTLAPGLQLASWLSALGRAGAQFVTGSLGPESHAEPGAFLVLPFVAVVLALAGGVAVWRSGRSLVAVAAVAVVLAYVVTATTADWEGHNFRYLTALLPPLAVLGIAALAALDRLPTVPRGTAAATALALVVLSAAGAPLWHARTVDVAGQLNGQHVWLGRWLGRNLPSDARIAFHDAGALKLYSDLPHFDWLGLVSPDQAETYRAGWGAIYERIERLPADERPDYFVMWPNLNQRLVDMPFVGDLIYTSPDLGPTTMLGGPTMGVYEVHWADPAVAAPTPAAWEVDVADLESEQAAVYEPAGSDPLRRPGTEVYAAVPTEGAERVAEGCRQVLRERFRVPAAGELVARLLGAVDAVVVLDGRPIAPLRNPGAEGRFTVLEQALPAGGEVEIRGAGPYVSCHWWLARRTGR